MTGFEIVMISAASLMVAVAFGLGIGFLIVHLKQDRDLDDSEQSLIHQPGWYLEIWDVSLGVRFAVSFYGSLTLGRSNQGSSQPGFLPVGTDSSISRQQCVIGELDGAPIIWNLSHVNPTKINGAKLVKPAVLHEGDRIVMGSRTFLLTRLAAIT